jgi:protein involved in polysaccharide export with SLBB domain
VNLTLRNRLISIAVAGVIIALPVALSAQGMTDTTYAKYGARPYDRPIDPDLYLIRPGEQLEVVFVNTKLPDLRYEVNAEGHIVERSLGVVDLSGLTLRQARERLMPALRRLYNAEQIEISVGSLYPVVISVSGLVNSPGSDQR